MRQFVVTLQTILLVIIYAKISTSAESLPTQSETKEALQKVGKFLKEEDGTKWLGNLASSGSLSLTTERLIDEIINSTIINQDVRNAAELIKLSLNAQEKPGEIDDLFSLENEGWKELIENVESHDDIICLYRKNANVSSQRSEDWQSFLKNVSPGYTVHLALNMGKKYVLCMKKIPVSELNATESSTMNENEVSTVETRKSLGGSTFLTSTLASTSVITDSPGGTILKAVMPFVDKITDSTESNESSDSSCKSSESGSCSQESKSTSSDESQENPGRRSTVPTIIDEPQKKQDEQKSLCNRPIIYILANYPMPSLQRNIGCTCMPKSSPGFYRSPVQQVLNYPRNSIHENLRNKFINAPRVNNKKPVVLPQKLSGRYKYPICQGSENCVDYLKRKIRPAVDRHKVQTKLFSRKKFFGKPIVGKLAPHRNLKENKLRENERMMTPPMDYGRYNKNWRILPQKLRVVPTISPYKFYGQNPVYGQNPIYGQNQFYGAQGIQRPPVFFPQQISIRKPLTTATTQQPVIDETNTEINDDTKKTDNNSEQSESSSSTSSEENSSSMESDRKCSNCPDPCDRPLNLKIIVDSPSNNPVNMKFITEPEQKIQIIEDKINTQKINSYGGLVGRRSMNEIQDDDNKAEENNSSEKNITLNDSNKNKILDQHFEDLKDAVNFYD